MEGQSRREGRGGGQSRREGIGGRQSRLQGEAEKRDPGPEPSVGRKQHFSVLDE